MTRLSQTFTKIMLHYLFPRRKIENYNLPLQGCEQIIKKDTKLLRVNYCDDFIIVYKY